MADTGPIHALPVPRPVVSEDEDADCSGKGACVSGSCNGNGGDSGNKGYNGERGNGRLPAQSQQPGQSEQRALDDYLMTELRYHGDAPLPAAAGAGAGAGAVLGPNGANAKTKAKPPQQGAVFQSSKMAHHGSDEVVLTSDRHSQQQPRQPPQKPWQRQRRHQPHPLERISIKDRIEAYMLQQENQRQQQPPRNGSGNGDGDGAGSSTGNDDGNRNGHGNGSLSRDSSAKTITADNRRESAKAATLAMDQARKDKREAQWGVAESGHLDDSEGGHGPPFPPPNPAVGTVGAAAMDGAGSARLANDTTSMTRASTVSSRSSGSSYPSSITPVTRAPTRTTSATISPRRSFAGHIFDVPFDPELEALGDAATGLVMAHLSPYSRSSTLQTDYDTDADTASGSGSGSGFGDATAMDADVARFNASPQLHSPADDTNRDRVVNQLLDKTSKMHCKNKKKLVLSNLNLAARDVPVDAICGKPLGETLHKLSLAGNRLVAVPNRLVGRELSGLHTLDLQQCDLTTLPPVWQLGSLRRLILSHNRLEEFLDEGMLKGLPELRHLDMYDNKLCEVILPGNGLLAKLEFLNLGFNNLVRLPDDLPQLRKLRNLKVMNNLITHIPKRVVCEMDLKELEVTPNPLIQPPIEDCERGICGMRRYYRCLAMRGPCDDEPLDVSPAHTAPNADGMPIGIATPNPMKHLRKQFKKVPKLATNKSKKPGKESAAAAAAAAETSSLASDDFPPELGKTVRGGSARMMKTISSKLTNIQNSINRSRSTSNATTASQDSKGSGGWYPTAPPHSVTIIPHNVADATPASQQPPSLFPDLPNVPLAKVKPVALPTDHSPTSGSRFDPFDSRPSAPPLPDTDTTAPSGGGGMLTTPKLDQERDVVLPSAPVLPTSPSLAETVVPSVSPGERGRVGQKNASRKDGDGQGDVDVRHATKTSEPIVDGTGVDVAVSSSDGPQLRAARIFDGSVEAPRTLHVSESRTRRALLEASSLPSSIMEEELAKQTILCEKTDVAIQHNPAADAALTGKRDSFNAEDFAVNDTLKIIFVGMAYTGKTSMIRRLKHGGKSAIPKREERTIGVDIYEWDPATDIIDDGPPLNTHVKREDGMLSGEVDVKFSVWDFAGQNVYHATHELFFSPRALYVLVWDMATNNRQIRRRSTSLDEEDAGPFNLGYDSSDDEDDNNFVSEQEARRADRALERDIDEKVQFWVDCIQSSVPGAAILPVASFDDFFDKDKEGGVEEARRRCNIMKKRLLMHEERRKAGLQQRLKQLEKDRRANTEAAGRLRKLLCEFKRPKLLFGPDDAKDGGVLRVSSTQYRGFEQLREKIVNISTGRDYGGFSYPVFRGHVGAVIPRMRLNVRDVVRMKRKELKVVEWCHFLGVLKDNLREEDVKNVDDVSDALHFLSNVGELSYFGGLVDEPSHDHDVHSSDGDDEDDDDEFEDRILAIDNIGNDPYRQLVEGDTGIQPVREQSFSHVGNTSSSISGLSDFVFLNPRWLVAVVACILRHDLRQEIDHTRRMIAEQNDFQVTGDWQNSGRGGFAEANLNCPIITAEEACMLWKTKKVIWKAAERAKNESANSSGLTAFEFLQKLLIKFNVFVPIDLNIEKALFGGEEYGGDEGAANMQDGEMPINHVMPSIEKARYFFLPSLLGPGEPTFETWTYKCSEAWKKTLCVSWSFLDGLPPGLMERVTANVLRDIYAVTQQDGRGRLEDDRTALGGSECRRHCTGDRFGKLRVHEILCWRSSFLLVLGMEVIAPENDTVRESTVEIFAHLVDESSPMCVAADSMSVGTRRLVVSGKGQEGDGGRKIWKGGLNVVTQAVERVVREYGGLEFEKQGVCPECLSSLPVKHASVWNWTQVRYAAQRGTGRMRCKRGHVVDTRLIGGFRSEPESQSLAEVDGNVSMQAERSLSLGVPVRDLLPSIVLVGLWDSREKKVVRAGSGFIVDRKHGLIVTASHTLMDMTSGSTIFGADYYGSRYGKALIGIIPQEEDGGGSGMRTTAVFRYTAEIVSKDPCNMDACVLKIKTRMECDVAGEGEGCGSQPEIPLSRKRDFKREGLRELKVSKNSEMEERVRILGYNQGGEGLVRPGSHLNRIADLAEGYVARTFETLDPREKCGTSRKELCPKAEIVAIVPTIGGHSGGPCVNQAGEVIGILSRADPADKQRCYLVPTFEFMKLVEEARRPVDPLNDLHGDLFS